VGYNLEQVDSLFGCLDKSSILKRHLKRNLPPPGPAPSPKKNERRNFPPRPISLQLSRPDCIVTYAFVEPGTLTIHPTPNLSVHIPNAGDQNVGASAICTLPPAASAS
jgi:hypothetical protein